LHNLKSTQDEDSKRCKRIDQTIARRLIQIQEEICAGVRDKCDDETDFTKGFCRMLGGKHATTSCYVGSLTMVNLLATDEI
jgi:hypothetical protein